MTTASKAMAAGAVSDFAFFDGMEKNLSSLVQEFPALRNPVTDFMAAEPGSEMEGRAKRALEGLGLGAVTEGLLLGLRALRSWWAARAAARKAGPEAVQKAVQEIEAGQAGMKGLGDVNEPLVRPVRVDEIAPFEPVQSTTHEIGVTAIPKGYRDIRQSADFIRAKKGDHEAAQRLVDKIWTPQQTQELAARLDPNAEVVFISVPGTSGKNVLPDALGQRLANELNGSYIDYRGIFSGKNTVAMKTLSRGDRPFSLRGYALENPEALQALAGKQVVVVEDVFTTGSSARQFINELRKHGIEVNSVAGLMGNARLDAPSHLEAVVMRLSRI